MNICTTSFPFFCIDMHFEHREIKYCIIHKWMYFLKNTKVILHSLKLIYYPFQAVCLVRAHCMSTLYVLICSVNMVRAFQDMIIWFRYKLKIFLWMTVYTVIHWIICAPLNGSTIRTFNKSQAHAIKRFSTYVVTVIFNWIISHVT